jgi:hypothetical protein
MIVETDTYRAAMSIYLATLEDEGILIFLRDYDWNQRLEMLTVSLHNFNISQEKEKEARIKHLINMSEKFERVSTKIKQGKKIHKRQYDNYIYFLSDFEAYEECAELKKLV